MSSQEEKLEFLPQNAYFIASLVLVNHKSEILLVKERNCDFWLTPGGELNYKRKEQFACGALRETFEEIGISTKEKPGLLDITISYPEGDNPYKEKNISMVVATYIAHFPKEQEIKLTRSLDLKERKYDVKEYFWIKPEQIINKEIRMPQYFINKVIPKIDFWIRQYGAK